ncbi:Uncharacterised protein [Staphylococcus microti]|uniref:Transposase n=1 Tax=Staphylococcus microti TaxID=569857 RepID=A0A380I8C7_9STAP|nr:Uncharacterised protein [Staphylococcus microti]
MTNKKTMPKHPYDYFKGDMTIFLLRICSE